jgi:hypothetical protein
MVQFDCGSHYVTVNTCICGIDSLSMVTVDQQIIIISYLLNIIITVLYVFVWCFVHQTRPVPFSVHSVVTTSDLQFDVTSLDFGYCTIHEAVKHTVELTNHSILPQQFGFLGVPEVGCQCVVVSFKRIQIKLFLKVLNVQRL